MGVWRLVRVLLPVSIAPFASGSVQHRSLWNLVAPRVWLLLLGVSSVSVALCLMSAANAAAASWSIQPVSQPPFRTGGLSAVSCSSAKACTAVGPAVVENGGNSTL